MSSFGMTAVVIRLPMGAGCAKKLNHRVRKAAAVPEESPMTEDPTSIPVPASESEAAPEVAPADATDAAVPETTPAEAAGQASAPADAAQGVDLSGLMDFSFGPDWANDASAHTTFSSRHAGDSEGRGERPRGRGGDRRGPRDGGRDGGGRSFDRDRPRGPRVVLPSFHCTNW